MAAEEHPANRFQPRLVTWYRPFSMSIRKGRAIDVEVYRVTS